MSASRLKSFGLVLICMVLVAGCGTRERTPVADEPFAVASGRESSGPGDGTSLFDLFRRGAGEVSVNRFLWTASLQVLDFLPVEAADPFTGVITTGFGTPPGGGQAYRATILISDPALDARALNVALQTRSGPVSSETQRAVEDAILNRARQLRIQAARF